MDKDMKAVKDRLVKWIQQRVSASGANGVVLGLSGGIDSSVVCGLAAAACGKDVLGVIMPIQSNSEDADHARQVADKFCVRTEHIDLGPAFRTMQQSLPKGNKIADANLKPRLRMLTLYFFANLHNYIVLGTGNKSELLVGYFTKFGDGGVDLLPIAGMYKHQVVELAKLLGVPSAVIKKPASAGLWPSQTDEAEMGLSYYELDSILQAIEKRETGGVDPAKLSKVRDMIERSEHKRRMAEIFEL